MVEATSTPEKWYSFDDWERAYAVEAASTEAKKSSLPGRENGPADAYRHLLWAGELTRRFGERRARLILGAHEVQGRFGEGYSSDAEFMDRYNNELGIAIGKSARTWSDVIRKVQGVMDGSDRSGTGGEGHGRWLPDVRWQKNPVDENTGRPLKLNWPQTDWIYGVQDLPYDYPLGGEEHRYTGESGSHGEEIPALERAVETWSVDDLRGVMASKAYQRPGSPEHEIARAKVQAWFQSTYGNGPAQADATGRIISGGPSIWSTAGAAGGSVLVSAHSREGGKIAVSAYDRSAPSR